MSAETRMAPLKFHPSSSCRSFPIAYIDTPEEKTVMTAKLEILRYGTGAGAVIKRHHEDAHKNHGRDGPNPVEVRGHDSVFCSAGAHTDDFLRPEVGGKERQPGNPGGNRPAGKEEIRAGFHVLLEDVANAQHEREINQNDGVVDPLGFWSHLVFPFRSPLRRENRRPVGRPAQKSISTRSLPFRTPRANVAPFSVPAARRERAG